jgi:hypothetical protein
MFFHVGFFRWQRQIALKFWQEKSMSQPDVRITEIESHLTGLRNQMEPITRQFEEAARTFLADWYFQQLEDMRQAHSETVTALGKDRIHMLKADVNGLVAQLPQRIEKEFSQAKYWTHRNEQADDPIQQEKQYVVEGEHPSDAFATGMSKLLGELGGILERYGFPVAESHNDIWGRKSLLQQGQYQQAISWPPSLLSLLKQYHPLCKEYVSAYLGLHKAKHDKEVEMANGLWDAS